jgi:hypothetical protein
MPERTIEDRLREEYFDLLPEIRRVAWQIETEIRYRTLPILQNLKHYEQLIVKSRVKDCESALKSLRRRQEGGTFDQERHEDYSILNLPDLAGVRALVFPRSKLDAVDEALKGGFKDWAPDPVLNMGETVLARKYSGHIPAVSSKVRAEYQVVPMLIGLFWEVEHSALYKPASLLKGKAESEPMQSLRKDVESVLLRFEAEFESFVSDNSD